LTDVLSQSILDNFKDGVAKNYLEKLVPGVISFIWCVILALLVWFIGVKLTNLLRKLISKAMVRSNVDKGVRQFTDNIVKLVCYAFMILIILRLFGVETSSVAAFIASLGVTVGLALQGSLSNFAGGVLILMLHPFRVGDYIVEDTHSNEGTVVEISLFYTKLKTIDSKIVVVPNGTLANASLTNVTAAPFRQMDLTVGISYESNIKKAKEILERIVLEEKRSVSSSVANAKAEIKLDDPFNMNKTIKRQKRLFKIKKEQKLNTEAALEKLTELDKIDKTNENNVHLEKDKDYSVFVKELADSSVNLGLRFYVKGDDYWPVRFDTIEKIKLLFDENGIEIPYNKLDVNLKND